LRRLVCDRCGGMLIARADLAEAFPEVVTATPDTPTERLCPLCARKLWSCRLRLGRIWLDQDVWMCARDGLWFGGGMLEEVFVARNLEL